MKPEEVTKKWRKIIARAWMDDAFRERLLSEPVKVLGEEGIEVPPGMEIRIVENTGSLTHLVLPKKPDDAAPEEYEDRIVTSSIGIF